jgi:hypothetical protein
MTTRQRDHLELERMASDAASTPYDVAVERAVDVGLRRACYGALAGTLAAATLVRGPRARVAALAFGVGVGVGSAYEEAQRAFASVK